MQTPTQQIMGAIREGNISHLQSLLTKHPDAVQEDGPLMLTYAAEQNRVDAMELLLTQGLDIDGTEDEESPLAAAAGAGALEAADWLLDHGADVNRRASEFDVTPLLQAVQCGELAMVRLLMDRQADPNVLNGDPPRNSLSMARLFLQDEVADFLQSRGVTEIVIHSELVDVESAAFRQLSEAHSATSWFEKTWPAVYEFALQRGLDSMSQRNQVLFLTGYWINEIADGGIASLYFNPSGEFTPLMPAALEQIGAKRAAEILREINAQMPEEMRSVGPEQFLEHIKFPPSIERLGDSLEDVLREDSSEGECALIVQLHAYYKQQPS